MLPKDIVTIMHVFLIKFTNKSEFSDRCKTKKKKSFAKREKKAPKSKNDRRRQN